LSCMQMVGGSLCEGTIQVSILNGRDLLASDVGGGSDPFVIFAVVENPAEALSKRLRSHGRDQLTDPTSGRTATVFKELNPDWNYTHTVKIPQDGMSLKFEVWDRDKAFGLALLDSHDFLGQVIIDHLEPNVEVQEQFELKPMASYGKGKAKGTLGLKLLYEPTNASEGSPSPLNWVEVKIVDCQDLPAMDSNGFSDPYCVVRHLTKNGMMKVRTATKPKDLNPKFDESFEFLLCPNTPGQMNNHLHIEVYDEDFGPCDDFIGRVQLLLKPTEGVQKLSLPLISKKGECGTINLEIKYSQTDKKDVEVAAMNYTCLDPDLEYRVMKESFGVTRFGKLKKSMGFSAHHPVLIVPGLCSSALECWESPKTEWLRKRVWCDPFKLGKPAAMKEFGNFLSRVVGAKREEDPALANVWMAHIMTAEDGFSDPEGIKVRPAPGLGAVDYLSHDTLTREPSYVMGHVINALIDVGYDANSLRAAPYDWRIPPCKMEERDGYYTSVKSTVELMYKVNKKPVVLMAHSMGNRAVSYFLNWAERVEAGWCAKHIYSWLSLAPPLLGATKPIRGVLSGDCMGLEIFMTLEEGRALIRSTGSVPWLLPLRPESFPSTIIRMREDSSFTEKPTDEILQKYAPKTVEFFEKHYRPDPCYYHSEVGDSRPPVLAPPPINRAWVVYGINVDTEVSYYFKEDAAQGRLQLDAKADELSMKQHPQLNPEGLRVRGGIAYETRDTVQRSAGGIQKSGDGTVPYASLNYCSEWKREAEEKNLPLDVKIIEIPGLMHREMLASDALHNCILDLVCRHPDGHTE